MVLRSWLRDGGRVENCPGEVSYVKHNAGPRAILIGGQENHRCQELPHPLPQGSYCTKGHCPHLVK